MSILELQGVRAGRDTDSPLTDGETPGGSGRDNGVLVTKLQVESSIPKSGSFLPPATFLSIKFGFVQGVCVLLWRLARPGAFPFSRQVTVSA